MFKSVALQVLGLTVTILTLNATVVTAATNEEMIIKHVSGHEDLVVGSQPKGASDADHAEARLRALVASQLKPVVFSSWADSITHYLTEYAKLMGRTYAAYHVQRTLREPQNAFNSAMTSDAVTSLTRNLPKQYSGPNDLNLLSVDQKLVKDVARLIIETLPESLAKEVIGKIGPGKPNAHNLQDALDLLSSAYRVAFRSETKLQVVRLTGIPESMVQPLLQRHTTFVYILTAFTNEFFKPVVLQDQFEVLRSPLALSATAVGTLQDWSPEQIRDATGPLIGEGPGGTASLAVRWSNFLADAAKLAAADGISSHNFQKLLKYNAFWRNFPKKRDAASVEPSVELDLATIEGKDRAIRTLLDAAEVEKAQTVPELETYQAPLEIKYDADIGRSVIHAFNAKDGSLFSTIRVPMGLCRAFRVDGK